MIRLLQIELPPLLRSKSFWILLGLYVFLFSLISYAGGNLEINMGGAPLNLSDVALLKFPDIWHNITWVAGIFNLLLAMIVIMRVTEDYTYKTLRQHLINGLTRIEYLGGKFLVIFLLSAILTLFMGGLGAIFGTGTFSFEGIEFLGAFLLQTFAYLSLAFFFGLLMRKAILAIGLFVLYTWLIEWLLQLITKWEFMEYLPDSAFDKLIQSPLMKYVGEDYQQHVALGDVGVSLFYVALIAVGCFFLLRQKDL